MDLPSRLRVCYRILEDRVSTALRTRTGDRQRLRPIRDDGLLFMVTLEEVSIHMSMARNRNSGHITHGMLAFKHKDSLPPNELDLIMSNIKAMVKSLDDAENNCIDPPNAPPPTLSVLNRTGRPGRPRIEIDPTVLSNSLPIEQKTVLANMLGCSARTVRRRQKDVEQQTGVSLVPKRSTLSDEELDAFVRPILEEFPQYGRSMLMGAMTVNGHNVPERRIRESLDRVRGAPGRFFGSRPIHRRKYYVPAANSLWHHDGQHGMFSSNMQIIQLRFSELQG
jgi:hypothetical protein